MLWWDDVAKGLAKLNQQNDTSQENGETTDTTTPPADTTPPATLSDNGKAWFIHPVTMHIFNFESCVCNKHITEDQFKSIMPNDILRNGLFYKMNNDLKNTSLSTFLLKLNKYFTQHNVTSCLQKAHFISQILCESDFLEQQKNIKIRMVQRLLIGTIIKEAQIIMVEDLFKLPITIIMTLSVNILITTHLKITRI
ncbi:hypothetical protein A9G28_06750 [Gilliamella sp. Fer1-1]|nr:hypothetical protein [Gilliamella apicola]OCG41087.1 hypothetical protein A9G28_06750 [Gilliamella apicola]